MFLVTVLYIHSEPHLLSSDIYFFQIHQNSNEFELGHTVDVIYLGRDALTGKVRVSRKALLPKPQNIIDHEEFIETYLSPSNDKGA